MQALERCEAEDDDTTIRASCYEDRVGQLQLANQRGMALEQSKAVSVCRWNYTSVKPTDIHRQAYPVRADQMRTVESNEPVTTRCPSKATA